MEGFDLLVPGGEGRIDPDQIELSTYFLELVDQASGGSSTELEIRVVSTEKCRDIGPEQLESTPVELDGEHRVRTPRQSFNTVDAGTGVEIENPGAR